MAAVGSSAGSYGRLIVTPDMEPPDASHWDAQEQAYRDSVPWSGGLRIGRGSCVVINESW